MALPEVIPLRYSEEEAGYVSFRPVVRQTFRLGELLDMVVSVTGKDPARVAKILRSGNIVFHFYRYWWEGFDAAGPELDALLARFPDPDPTRPFRAADCTAAIIEGSEPKPSTLELKKAEASKTSLLRRRSFWDALLVAAASPAPGALAYGGYSYAHRADLYRLDLTDETRKTLAAAAASRAPRNLRKELQALDRVTRIVFVCPRTS